MESEKPNMGTRHCPSPVFDASSFIPHLNFVDVVTHESPWQLQQGARIANRWV